MNTPMTPEEFQDYLTEMSECQFQSALDDSVVKDCLEKGHPYTQIWKEVLHLNQSLDSLDVPASRVNIATSVMASIANEKSKSKSDSRQNTFFDHLMELVHWKFQVPAWGFVTLVLLLLGSIGYNLLSGEIPSGSIHDQPIVAQNDPNGTQKVQPQIIHVLPQTPNSFVPVTTGGGIPLSANPSPSLVIIMGAPPTAWLKENQDYQPTTNHVSFKENET